mmetsp:Transcript_44234/g.123000  ORF Transcript_44234/g.123000 Transcript_44234/m.123000 type:complete len:215 (-) Transcript_44234:238-882(-)
MRVDGERVACAGGEDRASRVAALSVAVVGDPLGLPAPHKEVADFAMVPLIVDLLEGNQLRPAVRVANEVHALIAAGLANVQEDRGHRGRVRAGLLEFVHRVVVEAGLPRQLRSSAALARIRGSTSAWLVVVEDESLRVVAAAVPSCEHQGTTGRVWRLHNPAGAANAPHVERGLGLTDLESHVPGTQAVHVRNLLATATDTRDAVFVVVGVLAD